MSPSEKNSNVVEIQQLKQQSNSMPSSEEDLLQHMQLLEKRVKSLEVTNRVILGLLIGTLATAATVGSGFAIAAAPIIASSIVGGILATVALAALGVTAYKYRAQIKNGFKYAAEKTVEGAKHIGGKVKDSYEYSVGSLKRGAHLINEKTKEKASDILTATANKLYRAAGNENYSDRIDDELTPDSSHKRRVQGVKKDLKEIFADKGNNSALIESIRSGISEKIEGKIKAKEEVEFTSSADDFTENLGLITRWKEQKKFIDNLDADGLRKLVTERLVDKSKYFKDSIFSEHHDEIKEVIRECKENHLYSSVSNMFDKAEKKANKPSVKGLIRSISSPSPLPLSLRRSNSEQSHNLSGSSSMDSLSSYSTTSSEAELLNPNEHKEVKAPTSLWSKLSSSLKGGKKPEEVTLTQYERMHADEMPSAEIGNSHFYVAPPKPPRSNSMEDPFELKEIIIHKLPKSTSMGSISTDSTATVPSSNSLTSNTRLTRSKSFDSGIDSSGSSTPQEQSPCVKALVEKFNKSSRKLTGGTQPSSTVTVDTEVEQQASKINGK